MTETLEVLARAVVIGVGATIVMDAWAVFLKRGFGLASLDYAMVGRWIGHLPRGRFIHDGIGKSAPVPGERAMGWTAHYAIGVLFAAVQVVVAGPEWTARPTLAPALALGVATVVAPFFILQPGLGAGIAASKTPRPNAARLRSLVTHAVFGLGLYISAWLATPLFRS